MKYLLLLITTIFLSCQGKLSDEQRSKIKEGMKANEIRRFSDAEITEAAFALGRKITAIVQATDSDLSNKAQIDSLQNLFNVKITVLKPGDTILRKIESEIIEAYISNNSGFTPSDNIQKVGTDSMLYTLPILDTNDQGAIEFKFAMGVRMPRKEVVLSISN